MNNGERVVAVDVGNTAIKLGMTGASGGLLTHWLPIARPGWPRLAREWVDERLPTGPADWRIASVNRAASNLLVRELMMVGDRHRVHNVTHQDIPLEVGVEHPDRVGVDRLLGAWAARQEVGAPVAVIDAGSAVTVDWVAETGEFRGGAILPGVRLQLASLATGTEALPSIEMTAAVPLCVPGADTVAAIRLGVLAGVAGGIDRLIDDYLYAVPQTTVPIVLTGGDAAVISPQLRHAHLDRPNLICRGLLDLPRLVHRP